MSISKIQQTLLKLLPGVDNILSEAQNITFFASAPRRVLVESIRNTLEQIRNSIIDDTFPSGENAPDSKDLWTQEILCEVEKKVTAALSHNLRPLINGTGIVVHTNLGRSLLPDSTAEHIKQIATGYSNLEYDLSMGHRGIRYHAVEDIICKITGAEAAMVVNNNAGAVLLCLDTMASGKEVIVSRGELVEIGGSFRIPDVMAKSGGILKEIGTTNRTHVEDYQAAISDETKLLLKVHTSNFSVVGFTASVGLNELVELGKKSGIPVMEDLGSGVLVDFSKYGLTKEPTVMESVASGAEIITFSGDKLLGGPQAGIILGSKKIIERIKRNPLTRALRIDKLTLSALENILKLYLDEKKALTTIPTLRMLTMPIEDIEAKAVKLCKILEGLDDPRMEVRVMNISSKAGGGSLPLLKLPSKCTGIRINGVSANCIEKKMRLNNPPVIGRIEDDVFLVDLRTVDGKEISLIGQAVNNMLKEAIC